MQIGDKIKEAVAKNEKQMTEDPQYKSLGEFYTEMKRLGIAQKQEYELPQLDTTGRKLHEIVSRAR